MYFNADPPWLTLFEDKGPRFSTKQMLEYLLCIKQYTRHSECTDSKPALMGLIDKERYTQMSIVSTESKKWIFKGIGGRKCLQLDNRDILVICSLFKQIFKCNVNSVLNLISPREMMENKIVKYLPSWNLQAILRNRHL